MKKTINLVMLIGLLILHGHQTKSFGFGFGGLGGRGYTDAANLGLADRLGTFTPPADPFANRRAPGGGGGAGYGYGTPSPPIPNRVAAPQISASQLMNPATGGLANLGRSLSSGQPRFPVAPVQPQNYALPSDMGLHTFSPFSIPQQ